MPSFPQMISLPAWLDTTGWQWERLHLSHHDDDNFWIGVDSQQNRWLTKLRGSFYAYREIAFARLAQSMGWSCQSSVFIRLDADSASIIGRAEGEVHAAHWFMPEHTSGSCGPSCALDALVGKEIRTPDDLRSCEIKHVMDWPKKDFAAYIFGANEPSDHLITTSHELVIIDSEQMFSTYPSDFHSESWLMERDGAHSRSGQELAAQVCRDVAKISPSVAAQALSVPASIQVDMRWEILPLLQASIEFAKLQSN